MNPHSTLTFLYILNIPTLCLLWCQHLLGFDHSHIDSLRDSITLGPRWYLIFFSLKLPFILSMGTTPFYITMTKQLMEHWPKPKCNLVTIITFYIHQHYRNKHFLSPFTKWFPFQLTLEEIMNIHKALFLFSIHMIHYR